MQRHSRKLIFEKSSPSGTIVFRFYDSGSLLGFKTGHMEPLKNSEGGYLRFNNLKNVYDLGLLDKVLQKIDDLGVFDIPLVIEYADSLHRHLLLDWVKESSEDIFLSFAAFHAGIDETKGQLSYAELLTLVKANEALLAKAKKYNVLSRMIRPDLGFLSKDLKGKRDGEGIAELLIELERRRGSKEYSYLFERFEQGVESAAMSRQIITTFPKMGTFNPLGSYASSLLTLDENNRFHELIKRTGPQGMAGIYLDAELSLMVAYTLANHGESKTLELLMFLVNSKQNPEDIWARSHYTTVKDLATYAGSELTSEMLYLALDEPDTPLDLSLILYIN